MTGRHEPDGASQWCIVLAVFPRAIFAVDPTSFLKSRAVDRLGAVNGAAHEIRTNALPSVRALGQVGMFYERANAVQNNLVLAGLTDKAAEALRVALDGRDKAWRDYQQTISPGEEQRLADEVAKRWGDYIAIWNRIVELLKKEDRDGALALNSGEKLVAMGKLRDAMQADLDFNTKSGDAAAQLGERIYDSARLWIFGAIGLAIALCVGVAFLIIAGVSKPIAAMTEAMKRLAAHDLKTEIIGIGRKDEIGAMAGGSKSSRTT